MLEQAADDIEDDYELEGKYEGSLLNAVTHYLVRYGSLDSIVAELTSGSSVIETAIYQIYYEQACAALKNSADEIAEDL